LDRVLLTALMDRSRLETHTFHFCWGEMAPTLKDVAYLLGLPLTGDPIGPLCAPKDWAVDLIESLTEFVERWHIRILNPRVGQNMLG
jgi:hypothetical protein